MSHTQKPSVVITDLTFAWPDGDLVFSGITAAFGTGRTGLVGANGTGKTTLLRLIAGELTPSSGVITSLGEIGYLPQQLTLVKDATVASLLGISEKLSALNAIETGNVASEHFETIGDDWDIEARARALLDVIGLKSITLDRVVGTLSGGESMLVALTGLQLAGTGVVLLDEPTNNLDRESRRRLYEAIKAWRGALIVVSHDVALLDLMDSTAELRAGSLNVYGGGYSEFQEYLADEQAAVQQALRGAQQALKLEKKQRVEAETKLARRARFAQTAYENKREPRAVMKLKRRAAQVSAGRLRGELDDDVEVARQLVDEKEALVRKDSQISIDLPDPRVPAGRRLAEFRNPDGELFQIQGPERVALTGRNGIGKTRLLERLISLNQPEETWEEANKAEEGATPVAVGDRELVEKRDVQNGAVIGESSQYAALKTTPSVTLEDSSRTETPERIRTQPWKSVSAQLQTEFVGYLPQRLDHLDDEATILEIVCASAPKVPVGEVRNRLARFLFRADAVHRKIGDLSGGERFRVALATLLLADPPNQLLILDEPTNNLDLASVDELVSALSSYRGALLVVSHDDDFLFRLGIDTWLELREEGLSRQDPLGW